MPRRELREPAQIISWLRDWGAKLCENSTIILIGSGGLLWHVHQAGLATPKLKRGEPRDLAHANFMASLGLYQPES